MNSSLNAVLCGGCVWFAAVFASGCSPSQESSAKLSVLTGVDSVETGKQRPLFKDLSYLGAYLFGCVACAYVCWCPQRAEGGIPRSWSQRQW